MENWKDKKDFGNADEANRKIQMEVWQRLPLTDAQRKEIIDEHTRIPLHITNEKDLRIIFDGDLSE